MLHEELTQKIIGAAYQVHKSLGAGFLEKVYENALYIELEKIGLKVAQQYPINVFYKGILVGEFYADLYVDDTIILEIKAVENLLSIHETQLVNYLSAANTDIGLLINFGSSVTIKRKFRVYKNTQK